MLEINYMEMAKKIREKRKHINKSQEEFCRIIGIGRSTLSNIECDSNNSKEHTESEYEASFQNITFAQLVAMCNEFNCSLGHLIGEYDGITADSQQASNYTGLTTDAINILHDDVIERESIYSLIGKTKNDYNYGEILSLLLDNEKFWLFLNSLLGYQRAAKEFEEFTKGQAPSQYWKSKNYSETSKTKDLTAFTAQQCFFSLLESVTK